MNFKKIKELKKYLPKEVYSEFLNGFSKLLHENSLEICTQCNEITKKGYLCSFCKFDNSTPKNEQIKCPSCDKWKYKNETCGFCGFKPSAKDRINTQRRKQR